MPKINPFEQKNKNNIKEYRKGVEKIIYQSESNPNELIAVLKFNQSESPERIKARYYLSKILHLLFPQNIPDIHFASYNKKPILILEKIFLDELHNYLNENYNDFPARIKNSIIYNKFKNKIFSDKNYIKLSKELSLIGIFLDPNPLNYGYNKEGNLVYIDNSFIPWFTDSKGKIISLGYNPQGLKQKIEENLSGFTKDQALKYLARLETLRQNYENKINQMEVLNK